MPSGVQTHSCKATDIMSHRCLVAKTTQEPVDPFARRDEAPLHNDAALLTLAVAKLDFFSSHFPPGLKQGWKKVGFDSCREPEACKIKKKRKEKSPADALPCGPHPHPCLVHIHKCVCTGIYECEDGPFLPLKMTHKTDVLAT